MRRLDLNLQGLREWSLARIKKLGSYIVDSDSPSVLKIDSTNPPEALERFKKSLHAAGDLLRLDGEFESQEARDFGVYDLKEFGIWAPKAKLDKLFMSIGEGSYSQIQNSNFYKYISNLIDSVSAFMDLLIQTNSIGADTEYTLAERGSRLSVSGDDANRNYRFCVDDVNLRIERSQDQNVLRIQMQSGNILECVISRNGSFQTRIYTGIIN